MSYSGDGGPAISAGVSGIYGLATDPAGNLYLIDGFRIRRITPAGVISTFAGTGAFGSSGDGGPALQAQIIPLGPLASDSKGNLFFEQEGVVSFPTVRKIDSTGIITTVAGGGPNSFTCVDNKCGSATSGRFNGITAIAVGGDGTVYALDPYGLGSTGVIWAIDTQDNISIFSMDQSLQNFFHNSFGDMFYDPKTKALVFVAHFGGTVSRLGLDGSFVQDFSAGAYVNSPLGSALDNLGDLYLSDRTRIVRRNGDGSITVLFDSALNPGDIGSIHPMAADNAGGLYFGDARDRIFKIENAATCDNHAPLVSNYAALNAASYQGPIAPGSIVTIFGQRIGPDQPAGASISAGSFTTSTGNTRVLFDGVPAPIIYASAGQVNAIAPYAIAGEAYTSISLEVNGISSSIVTTTVADSCSASAENGEGVPPLR